LAVSMASKPGSNFCLRLICSENRYPLFAIMRSAPSYKGSILRCPE